MDDSSFTVDVVGFQSDEFTQSYSGVEEQSDDCLVSRCDVLVALAAFTFAGGEECPYLFDGQDRDRLFYNFRWFDCRNRVGGDLVFFVSPSEELF